MWGAPPPLKPLHQGFWVVLSTGEQSKSQLLKKSQSMESSTGFASCRPVRLQLPRARPPPPKPHRSYAEFRGDRSPVMTRGSVQYTN